MGTNYYLQGESCEHCDRKDPDLHIGKSSAGWYFSLHVIPDEGINSLADWESLFDKAVIQNEYGAFITKDEMLSIIKDRSSERDISGAPFGYDSWADFHIHNSSEIGINGLLRHRLSKRCIAHGDGTYDLIIGEFF